MPERISYEAGTPSWVDLTTTDLEGAKRFYGDLFGWQAEDAGPPEETGGYVFFRCNGRLVAGAGPTQSEGQPTAWATYFATDDADASAERATAAGATVLFGPVDVGDAGRMAVLSHPAAAVFGVWQAGEHRGAQLVNEPGALAWNELLTRAVEPATQALHDIFGLEGSEGPTALGGSYTTLMLGASGVAGILPMPGDMPPDVPAFWQVYFAVSDCDASVARAGQLGGSVALSPMTVEGVGRIAALTDPAGGLFGVVELAQVN